MVCSLELTVGAKQRTVIALLVHSVANVALSTVKQVLVKMKHGCPAWFGLFHPHLLLETNGDICRVGEIGQYQGTK